MTSLIRKNRTRLLLFLCGLFCILFSSQGMIKTRAAEDLPIYIYAEYLGGPALVGDEIDRNKIEVRAVYEDNSSIEVVDYQLSADIVQTEGNNEISVAYLGMNTSFYIYGRSAKEITAQYTGSSVSVGNAVNRQNLYVIVTYEDGSYENSEDYEIKNPVIEKEGQNEIIIAYGNLETAVTVNGHISPEVSLLQASYAGGDVMLGTKFDRGLIYVTAIYIDGSSETIVNYELSMDKPTMIGANNVIVSYGGKAVNFLVNGYERTIEKLSARYIGSGVEVGKDVSKKDIKAVATFSDGSVENVTDFDLPTPTIFFEGAHQKTVHFMGMTCDIYVVGVAELPVSYDNAYTFTISNGTEEAECSLALPSYLDEAAFVANTLRKANVSQVVPRVIRRSKFIPFEIIAEPEGEDELPLEMKIKIPKGYRAQDCVLYYTPNRKTIVGQMDSYVNEEGELVTTVYKMGTFLL